MGARCSRVSFSHMSRAKQRNSSRNSGGFILRLSSRCCESRDNLLLRADMVFIATHSQGSIVSTHLLASLIEDGHIRTDQNRDAVLKTMENSSVAPPMHPQKVLCLALCGIHLGPLLYLNTGSLTQVSSPLREFSFSAPRSAPSLYISLTLMLNILLGSSRSPTSLILNPRLPENFSNFRWVEELR